VQRSHRGDLVVELDEIHGAAAHWVIETGEGLASEQQLEFENRLSVNLLNRVVFIRPKAFWRDLGRMSQLRPFNAELNQDLLLNIDSPGSRTGPTPTADSLSSARRIRWKSGAAIASVLIRLAVSVKAVLMSEMPTPWDTYGAPTSASRNIISSDESVVHLNVDGELRIGRRAIRKEIELPRGDALFNVGESTHQLVVQGGQAEIRAATAVFRTALNVELNLEHGDVQVLVYEWHISLDGTKVSMLEATPMILVSGGYAHLQPGRISFAERPDSPVVSKRFDWAERKLVFSGETLAEAVSEFNRYNSSQIVIADTSIAGIRIGGRFSADDPDSFIAALCVSVRVSASELKGATRVIVLLPAGRADHDLCRP
jgi:transmembrane sensor